MSHNHEDSLLMDVRNPRSREDETHDHTASSSPRIYTREEFDQWLHERNATSSNTSVIDSDASSDSDQSLWDEELGERSTDVDLSYEGTIQIYRDVRPDLVRRCDCQSEASDDEEEDFDGVDDDDDDASWIFVEIDSDTDEDEVDEVDDDDEGEAEDEDVPRVAPPARNRYYIPRRRLFHGTEGIECLARLFVEYRHHQTSDQRGLVTFAPDWAIIAPRLDESPDALRVREVLLNIVARFFDDQDEEIVTNYEYRLMREVGISPDQMVRSIEYE